MLIAFCNNSTGRVWLRRPSIARIHALKSFYEFLFVTADKDEYPMPIKPSHYVRQGRPLPQKLTTAEVKRLFAAITIEIDKTLFLLMLRCGLRVAEVAALRLSDIDWTERALIVRQGKGRKDRRVYLSNYILSSLEQLLNLRPRVVPADVVFWNQKRLSQPLSIKAIQKKMERYAKSAGIKASCHSLRHTFASNLLEAGAEVIYIKEFLGHWQHRVERKVRQIVESAGQANVPAINRQSNQ
jgi:integrase